MNVTVKLTDPSLAGRVAIYARVSTEDQCKDPENSLDNQRHRCVAYLKSQKASSQVIDSVRTYREEGESGKDTNRPQLQQLLRDVRNGSVRLILFTELSRISRSVSDFLKMSEYLTEHDVAWVSLTPNIDLTSPYGQFMLIMLVALGELERKTTAERTRKAMRDRAERGLYNGGSNPLGFEPDPERKGNLRVVESEAAIVREAFACYLERGSIAETHKILQERGYRRAATVSRRGKPKGGNAISPNTLNYLLRNPTYIGMKEVNHDKRDLPVEEALALDEADRYRLVPAVWEPIIESDTFEAVQALMEENRLSTANCKGVKKYDYVLSGIVHCAVCGRGLEGGAAKKQTYHYYKHATGTVTGDCGPVGHPASLIEEAVLDRLTHLAEDTALLDAIVEKANERIEDGVPEKERLLRQGRRQVDELQGRERGLTEHMLSMKPGDIPRGFVLQSKELERAIDIAQAEVRRHEDELHELKASRLKAEDYREALTTFTEVYEHLDAMQRSDLLAYLLDRVEVRAVMEGGKQAATEITITLLGEAPDVARYEKGADGVYHQPPRWLRLLDSNQRPSG